MSTNATLSKSLKSLHTFGIDVLSNSIVTARNENELIECFKQSTENRLPTILLGEGSNVLFIESFEGTVLLNRIKGVTVSECCDHWKLHVGAGEIWHDVVVYCLNRKMPGLENLALIPGCVGAAPIQNIGAYGVEFKQFCQYVDVIHIVNGERRRLSVSECRFGYRDSIFKHDYKDDYAIVSVGLRLSKVWKPVLSYGELKSLDSDNVTPSKIFEAICTLRRSKIPDPNLLGNAGSFFKNPIVENNKARVLLSAYPDAPHYTEADGKVKLAAGWLIDKCHLKRYRFGGAAVHDKQALVLVNIAQATGRDVVTVAKYVQRKVQEKFNIRLEPEVRLIGSEGEVIFDELLSSST